jgi:hypothetical protein
MESIGSIAGNNLIIKKEALNICTTFDERVSIPVLFILDTPEHKHITMELFTIPWSNYIGPVRINALPPLYANAHKRSVHETNPPDSSDDVAPANPNSCIAPENSR